MRLASRRSSDFLQAKLRRAHPAAVNTVGFKKTLSVVSAKSEGPAIGMDGHQDPKHREISLATSMSSNVRDSPTARFIATLGQLKDTAAAAGYKPDELILANIGDVAGIPELPVMKEARTKAVAVFNGSSNSNGYPPYPGLVELRQAVAEDLMRRLGFADPKEHALVQAGVLLPGQTMFELVAIGAGSVGCSGSICSHVKYHRSRACFQPSESVTIALDRTHYWKHQGVAEDVGKIHIYDFMTYQEDGLHLNMAEVQRFGTEGGGIMVLNFANPLCFLPSAEEASSFVSEVAKWNSTNPSQEITVCIDGPYDDFDGADGYRFVSKMLEAGVTTSYIHARTKEEFATGGRGGEVFCNNPIIRQLFNAYKADYIGSDSKLEQEIALHLHHSPCLEEQKRSSMSFIRQRKEFFWSQMEEHVELAKIRKDTEAFYRPTGPFYVYLNLQSLISEGKYADSMEICTAMAKMGVILVPGTLLDINPDCATGLNKIGVRVSFAAFVNEAWQSQIKGLVDALAKL